VLRLGAWVAVTALGIGGVSIASAMRNPVPGPSAPSVTASSRTASAPALPPARPGGPAQVLQQIHNHDARAADGLAEAWVAQLATQPAAASTSDDAALSAVLAGHRALQRRNPNVLLLWSDDWNYTERSWITVLNQRFATAEEANAWCDSQDLAPRQCFAKRLSHTGSTDGSVKYRG
jgi:hypothetical protein